VHGSGVIAHGAAAAHRTPQRSAAAVAAAALAAAALAAAALAAAAAAALAAAGEHKAWCVVRRLAS